MACCEVSRGVGAGLPVVCFCCFLGGDGRGTSSACRFFGVESSLPVFTSTGCKGARDGAETESSPTVFAGRRSDEDSAAEVARSTLIIGRSKERRACKSSFSTIHA